MSSLADKIEQYIKVLIEHSGSGSIELQRLELAETFQCVPSQITYVISTRFTPRYGFIAESKRGGKGYVRVTRLDTPGGGRVKREEALGFVDWLSGEGQITAREEMILNSIIETIAQHLEGPEREEVLFYLVQAVTRVL